MKTPTAEVSLHRRDACASVAAKGRACDQVPARGRWSEPRLPHNAIRMELFLIVLTVLALLAVTGIVYQAVADRHDARCHPAPGALVDIGDCRLHARCAGEGRPVVIFEAGIAASSISWSLVQPEIAAITRTCSYDRAGLAWSAAARSRRTLAALVDELARLTRALSLEPPYILVAHSFGTFVARAFAAARRGEVAGMVLVDPIATDEWLDMTAKDRRLLRGGVFLSRVGGALARLGVVRACLTLLAAGSPGVPRGVARLFGPTAFGVLERLVGEVQKLPEDAWPAVRALWCRPRSFRGMAAYLAALPASAAHLAATAEPRDVALVVLSAANSSPERLRAHDALARSSSHGIHRRADAGGHWINLDEPSLVIDAVRELVEGVRVERAR